MGIKIPTNKQWRGVYEGNYLGNLWQTYNVDLERNRGRLKLSDKFRILTDGDDAAAPGIPWKFLRTNADNTDRWWCLSSSKMLNTAGTNAFTSYSADGLSNTPTDPLDMEVHEDANGEQRLVVTRATDIAILNRSGSANAWTASWWQTTLSQAALSSVVYHPLARLQRLLVIGDREKVHTISKSDVVSNARLQVTFGYESRCFYAGRDRVWMGFQNNFGDPAKILEWDGSSISQNNEYKLIGSYPLCGFIINDIPYFIDEIGFIYQFSGGGIIPVAQFPMVEEKIPFSGTTLATTNTIVPYGVAVYKRLAYILVGAPTASRRMRSGVWVFDSVTGNLYHARGIGQHKTAGTDIDYGASPLFRPGTLRLIIDASNNINDLLAGAAVYKNYTSTTKTVILRTVSNQDQSSNAGRNRGYFITPFIPIAEVNAAWQEIWTKFRQFVSSSNSIIVKYRVVDPLRDAAANDESVLQATGTWASTTTFTSVVPTGVAVGHEVEVMSGDNAGVCEHITVLSATPDGSATITVTLENAVPQSSTNGALFNFDNWTSVGSITSQSIGNQALNFPSNSNGEFIQLKIELRGFSVEIDELEITYAPNQSSQ